MIAIITKFPKHNTYSVLYLKDNQWNAAKKSAVELEILHGRENVRVDFVDDFPMGEEEFWRKDWRRF